MQKIGSLHTVIILCVTRARDLIITYQRRNNEKEHINSFLCSRKTYFFLKQEISIDLPLWNG